MLRPSSLLLIVLHLASTSLFARQAGYFLGYYFQQLASCLSFIFFWYVGWPTLCRPGLACCCTVSHCYAHWLDGFCGCLLVCCQKTLREVFDCYFVDFLNKIKSGLRDSIYRFDSSSKSGIVVDIYAPLYVWRQCYFLVHFGLFCLRLSRMDRSYVWLR